MSKACTAVVVAAGSARRMQGIDKIMAQVGGVPMLLRTALALSESEFCREKILKRMTDMLIG